MDNLVDGVDPVNEVAQGGLRTIMDMVWLLRWLVGAAGVIRRWWIGRQRPRRRCRVYRPRRLVPDAC